MDRERQILSISGSLRRLSTNTAVLATDRLVFPAGIAVALYEGVSDLPHFNPDDDGPGLPPPVAALRAKIRSADAVLFSTPEYAGALPGSFKNVLDWAVGDDQPGSLDGKHVAWLNVSSRGAQLAHESLRSVLGYVGAVIVESACLAIPVTRHEVDGDGLIPAEGIRVQIARALRELAAASAEAEAEAGAAPEAGAEAGAAPEAGAEAGAAPEAGVAAGAEAGADGIGSEQR